MFATRYFAARYYAPRYFPKIGAEIIFSGFLGWVTDVWSVTEITDV